MTDMCAWKLAAVFGMKKDQGLSAFWLNYNVNVYTSRYQKAELFTLHVYHLARQRFKIQTYHDQDI